MRTMLQPATRLFVWTTSKLRRVVVAYLLTRLLAVLTFGVLEDWTFLDAYWWGEVASLTIGYGDLSPQTTVGRLLAGPFHFFWVYYCGLAIGGHIVLAVFKNRNEMTHEEQEWLFHVVTVVYGWVRWLVQARLDDDPTLADRIPVPFRDEAGMLEPCPEQPHDTEAGDLEPVGFGSRAAAEGTSEQP